MVAGDVVNGVMAYAVGAFQTFQPAASVECALTCVRCGTSPVFLTDGVVTAYCTATPTTTMNFTDIKLLITNTNYFTAGATVSSAKNAMYSGIQIK